MELNPTEREIVVALLQRRYRQTLDSVGKQEGGKWYPLLPNGDPFHIPADFVWTSTLYRQLRLVTGDPLMSYIGQGLAKLDGIYFTDGGSEVVSELQLVLNNYLNAGYFAVPFSSMHKQLTAELGGELVEIGLHCVIKLPSGISSVEYLEMLEDRL